MNPKTLAFLAWTATLLAAPARSQPASSGEDAKFLPFMVPRLEAARYAPADAEFAWVGWIGAQVDLVEKGRWSAYFTPDVETILGHRVRSFEAVQANYSLELGARRDVGRGRLQGFFHHVSRHVQDREKRQAVDWNFLGAGYDSPWPAKWNRRGGFKASLGVATLSSGVEYDWEGRLSGDIDVVRKGSRALFALADLRRVGAKPTPGFPRGGFTDFRGEMGFRSWRDKALFDLFVAYERRNDGLITAMLVSDRALFGFRIRGQRRPEPAIAPLP